MSELQRQHAVARRSVAARDGVAPLLAGVQAAGFDSGDPAFADCYDEDDGSSDALSTWSGQDACEVSSEEPELKETVASLHDDSDLHGAS